MDVVLFVESFKKRYNLKYKRYNLKYMRYDLKY